MNRNLQNMMQVFIRIIFRSIGRQEQHLNFILVFFQPGRSKFAVMDVRLSRIRNTFCFETRIRCSINRISRCWFMVS